MVRAVLMSMIFLFHFPVYAQTVSDELERENAFFKAADKWFSAWKLLSKKIYKIKKVTPVEFVFFDDQYVYSTSPITIREGTIIRGPNLMNLKLQWKKTLHHDSLQLPDHSVVPVSLMSFAAETGGENSKPFFVMPLPGFWKLAGVGSKELGVENLITGVFLHEFSHSQQMQHFGKKIASFERTYQFGTDLTDDIVQNLFSKDSSYVNQFKKEVEYLYELASQNIPDKLSVQQGMHKLTSRQKNYFKDVYKNLSEVDDFFLTMEGLGQYSMYLWLVHPKGGNLDKGIAIKGVRRGGKWWSQDEGFALFLILGNLSKSKSWAKDMFGDKTETVISLINR